MSLRGWRSTSIDAFSYCLGCHWTSWNRIEVAANCQIETYKKACQKSNLQRLLMACSDSLKAKEWFISDARLILMRDYSCFARKLFGVWKYQMERANLILPSWPSSTEFSASAEKPFEESTRHLQDKSGSSYCGKGSLIYGIQQATEYCDLGFLRNLTLIVILP